MEKALVGIEYQFRPAQVCPPDLWFEIAITTSQGLADVLQNRRTDLGGLCRVLKAASHNAAISINLACKQDNNSIKLTASHERRIFDIPITEFHFPATTRYGKPEVDYFFMSEQEASSLSTLSST